MRIVLFCCCRSRAGQRVPHGSGNGAGCCLLLPPPLLRLLRPPAADLPAARPRLARQPRCPRRHKHIGRAVCRKAEELGAEPLVVAAHDKGPLETLFVGSVSK